MLNKPTAVIQQLLVSYTFNVPIYDIPQVSVYEYFMTQVIMGGHD